MPLVNVRERLGRPTAVIALEGEEAVYVVGGAVRDVLLGRRPHEIDFVVEGDAVAVARRAAERLGGRVTLHQRFGTPTVDADDATFGVARARRGRYQRPGAPPGGQPRAAPRGGPPPRALRAAGSTAGGAARRVARGGPRAARLHGQRDRAAPRRRGADVPPGRPRGPRCPAPAGAPRRLVPGRSDAVAAHGPLRGAAGLRRRAAHGRARGGGDRRRGAGDRLRLAAGRRAAPAHPRAAAGGARPTRAAR